MKRVRHSILKTAVLIILAISLSVNISVETLAASKVNGNAAGLLINEVCASNKKSLKDADGDSPDWIELYNPTSKTIRLSGCGLSDDKGKPFKWTFPDVSVKPGGYLIVFASDKDRKSGELHTNFKISGGKDTLYLTSSDKKICDSFFAGEAMQDETCGRYPDGSKTVRTLSPTPGKSNNSVKEEKAGLMAPKLSLKSGFYNDKQNLRITAESGLAIYYTTDGSVPTKSSKKYTSSIEIADRSQEKAVLTYKKGTVVNPNDEYFPRREFEKATVIRAAAIDSKGNVSPVSTGVYFIGRNIADKYKNVSVMSVVADPNDLYNSKTGIYVAGDVFKEWRKDNPGGTLDGGTPANFNQRGREWEKEVHVDFFDGTKLGFSAECGMRIQGGWSRNVQQKSMKFYMRSEYGDSKLTYSLFENNTNYFDGEEIKDYKRFMLRNGGNDTYPLKFKCPWTQSLVKDCNFATQDDRLVVCFLDGEYWGVYTMNDVYDNNYVETNYGVPADDVVMIKTGDLEEGVPGDEALFSESMRFIEKNDMSKPENYKKACEMFDMDSVADYMAVETYIGNQDWLWNNWACWRSRSADKKDSPYQDGRWRFMLYDTEFAMDLYGNGNNYKEDILSQLINGGGRFSKMFKSLLKSDEFRAKFVLSFEKTANVAFNPYSAGRQLEAYFNEYSPYLEQHFKRFVGWQSVDGVKRNVSSWKNWLKNRNSCASEMLKKNLNLKNAKTSRISLTVEGGGYVALDGIKIVPENGRWFGSFLSGFKFTLTAVPEEGYEFAGWSGSYDGTASSIRINPNKAYSFTAKFVKKQ